MTAPQSNGDARIDLGELVNNDAEQALLAGILYDNRCLEQVPHLDPEHFAEPMHGRIYAAARSLAMGGQTANAVTLKQMFDQADELAEVGGARYLAELQGNYISLMIADYARVIVDLWLRRRMIEACEDHIGRAAEDHEASALQIVEAMGESALDLAGADQSQGPVPLARSIPKTMDSLHQAHAGAARLGTPSGFTDLDKLIGGLAAPDVSVLAGRPGMGKTAMLCSIALGVAGQGVPVQIVSMEQSASQLERRMIAAQAQVDLWKMNRGYLDDTAMERVAEAAAGLAALPIHIDDSARQSAQRMTATALRLKRRGGLGLVLIDHLGYMEAPDPRAGRVQQLGDCMKGLKAGAKATQAHWMVLCQLNRAVLAGDNKRPSLEHLRESGQIEEDADLVFFLHREGYYLERREPARNVGETEESFKTRYASWSADMQEHRNTLEVILAKQRDGPIGTAKVFCDLRTMRITDLQG